MSGYAGTINALSLIIRDNKVQEYLLLDSDICTKVGFTIICIPVAWRLPSGMPYTLILLPTASSPEYWSNYELFCMPGT